RHDVEVGGFGKCRDELSALARAVAILDRRAYVPDVEVERVAVQKQEEGRDDDENDERAPVAADLPQFLDRYREGAPHAAPVLSARATTSRNTSSSDGATGSTLKIGRAHV